MIKNGMPPIHLGEILREEFLVPLQTDTTAFAERLGVPAATVEAVVNERAPVTPELASKLAAFFDTSEGFGCRYRPPTRREVQRPPSRLAGPCPHAERSNSVWPFNCTPLRRRHTDMQHPMVTHRPASHGRSRRPGVREWSLAGRTQYPL